MRWGAGSGLVEFAIAWPLALMLVLAAVQLSVWGAESSAAHQAALAGARVGQAAGAAPDGVARAALAVLNPALVGVRAVAACPSATGAAPPVWVCAVVSPTMVKVAIGGSVPSLVPLLAGGGLPIAADLALPREVFR
ncbi:MAG: hypothetical protein NVS9B1_17370 [Candidatus Dormibacteraceae bacterium]